MHIGGGGTNASVGIVKQVGAADRDQDGRRILPLASAVVGIERDTFEVTPLDAVTKGEAIESGDRYEPSGASTDDCRIDCSPCLGVVLSVSGVGSWNVAEGETRADLVLDDCGLSKASPASLAISLSCASFPSSISRKMSSIPLDDSVGEARRGSKRSLRNSYWLRLEGPDPPRGVNPVEPENRASRSPPRPGVRFVHCAMDKSTSLVGVAAPYVGTPTVVGSPATDEEAEYAASRPENIGPSHFRSVRL